ncbi:hypothetical protein K440DRAFT_630539 [Wilcoxina mikolae CBS 423.85]|nr:hypothetical protein K440DRAFT_630539 [Wilcoxina mikolae CBS 423.85]
MSSTFTDTNGPNYITFSKVPAAFRWMRVYQLMSYNPPFSSQKQRQTPSPSMVARVAIAGIDRVFPPETTKTQSTGSESHKP